MKKISRQLVLIAIAVFFCSQAWATPEAQVPDSVREYVNKAIELSQEKKILPAIEMMEKACQEAPDYPELQSFLARLYAEAGQHDQALAAYEKAVALGSQNPITIGDLANEYLIKGDMDKAVIFYEKAVSIDPNDSINLFGLGKLYLFKGKNDLAKEKFAAAAKAAQKDGQQGILKQAQEALGAFSLMEKTAQTGSSKEIFQKGLEYFADGKYPQALGMFDIFEYSNPLETAPELYASIMLDGKKDFWSDFPQFQAGLQKLENAIKDNPQDANLHYYLGRFYRFKGTMFVTSTATPELSKDAQRLLWEKSSAELKISIELDPNFKEAYYYLGTVYVRMQQYDEAAKQVERALSIDFENSEYHTYLAGLYCIIGKIKDAESEYRIALRKYKLPYLLSSKKNLEFILKKFALLKSIIGQDQVKEACLSGQPFAGEWNERTLEITKIESPYISAEEQKKAREQLEEGLRNQVERIILITQTGNTLLAESDQGDRLSGFCYGPWFVLGRVQENSTPDCLIDDSRFLFGQLKDGALEGVYIIDFSTDNPQKCPRAQVMTQLRVLLKKKAS